MPDVPPTPEVPPESESESEPARFPGIHALAGRGTPLSRDAYLAHFREEYPHSPLIDKLEVRQDFREPGYAPWEAAQRGDWAEALSLAESERPALARQYEQAHARGARLRRVRFVELPPSDYLLWEMSILRLRAELGEEIRVHVMEQGRGVARTDRPTSNSLRSISTGAAASRPTPPPTAGSSADRPRTACPASNTPQRICRNSSSSGRPLCTSCGTRLRETSTARYATPVAN
ncbi:DUF6879 family protein [Streptomyces flaveus]|uniref:DUF6879 domain-containing protein n=1 Tax=Streptomyces flaveus TaxID=66370 RepID=A0A917RHH9_9ACTN|nr:DUF6879 family protein [Streptomyces flaveus]GGL06977.1 hypothetical protein GCM10010094_79740 [Streptomyces flaveus]